jgi:hypothetical protein
LRQLRKSFSNFGLLYLEAPSMAECSLFKVLRDLTKKKQKGRKISKEWNVL